MTKQFLASIVARAMLAGPQEIGSIIERVRQTAGHRGLPGISRRYLEAFAKRSHPRRREVIQFLLNDPGFQRLRVSSRKANVSAIESWPQPVMRPSEAAEAWSIPPILTTGDLSARLRLTPTELDWLADSKQLTVRPSAARLHHYYYSAVRKRSGASRLIESPKQHLKLLQRQILRDILNGIPSHPAAHGFIRGRSIRTFASPHVDQRIVLRMDIENFFPSITASRVAAFFRTAGYPEPVADALANLCCNAVPEHVLKKLEIAQEDKSRDADIRSMYLRTHLPQGAPTSPALANICAYRLDCRLQGLAAASGAVYTRYADDLAFSGGEVFERSVNRFADHVGAILLEEGFCANYRKTRIQRRSTRQQLAGLIVNQRLNTPRREFDTLKAILTNCIRLDPASQNRDQVSDFRAHMLGRIVFVESIHPSRGAKLRNLFDQIIWSDSFRADS
ncbi:reverse transcriptase family protein [Acidicapsa dinghuensis]|uniref:RNA-directed DNA polymerase n=1 Tax=Acidicapsa dinghuensis TaxID=2218256 RepID=A0ABW1ECJ5_9BACT|nr:reverse transcriptase family protein [Acidicapsa dinghuensis]